MSMAAINCGTPFVSRYNKSQHILVAMAGHHFKIQHASLEGEILLSGSILALDLVRHSLLEKLG